MSNEMHPGSGLGLGMQRFATQASVAQCSGSTDGFSQIVYAIMLWFSCEELWPMKTNPDNLGT